MPAKGTSQFGPNVKVGTKEYWKKWREKNRDKQRLYMQKYHAARKEEETAQELSRASGKSFEECMAEIRERVELLRIVRAQMRDEGKFDAEGSIPYFNKVALDLGTSYDKAKQVANANPFHPEEWPDDIRRLEAKSAAGLLNMGITLPDDEPPTSQPEPPEDPDDQDFSDYDY